MGSLRNIEAINKMLIGDHRTQSRSTFGYSDITTAQEKNKKREIGEVWIETNPATGAQYRVEQMKGYRRRQTVQGHAINEALGEASTLYSKCYEDCDKRKTHLYSGVDKKIAMKTQMCCDCLARFETQLRYKGRPAFDQYAMNKMKQNAEAWLKQADQEVEAIKTELARSPSYVNADGRAEHWTSENVGALIDKIEADYEKFKQELLTNLDYDSNKTTGIELMAPDPTS